MARGRAGQQGADRLNGRAVTTDDSTDIRLAQLQPEDRCLPRRNLGEHHLIREFDELTNNELEKLFHGCETYERRFRFARSQGAVVFRPTDLI